MKGDKGDKKKQFNKVAELIYKTSLNWDFRFDLSKLRARFGIIPQELTTDKKRNDWYATLTDEEKTDYWNSIFDFFIKYQLPIVSRWLIHYYVCHDKIPLFSPKASLFNTCELDFEANAYLGDSSVETRWKKCGQPFICLYISDLTSLDDIKYFLDKNWKAIKRNLSFQWAGKGRRIRPADDKEIHEYIYFLSLRSRKILGIKGKEYKEVFIAKLVNEKYKERKKKYSQENIKQIINRQKKLRKK